MRLLANSSCTFDSTSNSTARLMALSSSGERAPALTIALRAASGSSPGGAPGSISAAVALTAAVALAAAEMLAASAADRSGCCALLAPSSGSSAPCRGIKRWGVCVAGEGTIPRSAAAGGAAEASVVGGDSLRKILSDSEPYGGIEEGNARSRRQCPVFLSGRCHEPRHVFQEAAAQLLYLSRQQNRCHRETACAVR